MEKEAILGRIILTLANVQTEMLGTFLDLANKLAGENGQEIYKLLKHLLRGEVEIVKTKILDFIGTVTVSATTKKFVANDHFKLQKDGGICSWFGDYFTEWLLKGDGKIEEPIEEQELRYADLSKASVDGPIIEGLGGEEKVGTALTEMFFLMEKQSKGHKSDEGPLLTDGRANIFYVRDISGVLRAVIVRWFGVGWYVLAFSVEDPFDWRAGYRVFSRNS